MQKELARWCTFNNLDIGIFCNTQAPAFTIVSALPPHLIKKVKKGINYTTIELKNNTTIHLHRLAGEVLFARETKFHILFVENNSHSKVQELLFGMFLKTPTKECPFRINPFFFTIKE